MTQTPVQPLHVQTLLRERGLDALAELAIKVTPSQDHPELVGLNYHQYFAPKAHPVVQECRGIILDTSRDYAVVAYAFSRFFNLGEEVAAPVDWSTAVIEDKLDGTLILLYAHAGAWHVATRGRPDASGMTVSDVNVRNPDRTFRGLFWETFGALGYAVPPQELQGRYSFAFELMTLENQVVVRHERPALVLHGVRNLDTLEEEDPRVWGERLGYRAVGTHDLDREGMLAAAAAAPGAVSEGFIVRDAAYRRVKVKGADYVRISLLKGSMTERGLVEAVLAGETDELLAVIPELRAPLARVTGRLEHLEAAARAVYAEHAHLLPDRKAFALPVKDHPLSALVFPLAAGQQDVRAQLVKGGAPFTLRLLAALDRHEGRAEVDDGAELLTGPTE